MSQLLIGTNPHEVVGARPEGIWSSEFDRTTGEINSVYQLADLASASFLARNFTNNTVLAVSETENGGLVEFSFENEQLVKEREIRTNGDYPCHLIVADGNVVVANYGTGSVFAHKLPLAEAHDDSAGQLFKQEGSGPVLDRQEGPHAHFVQQITGTPYVWVVDLGADRIFKYSIGSAGLTPAGVAVEFPAGAGPRHVALSTQGLAYVVGELDNRVYVVSVDSTTGNGEIVSSVPILTEPVLETIDVLGRTDRLDTPDTKASHIALCSAETELFVAVRGADVVVAFEVLPTGGLEYAAHGDVTGEKPRHFAVLDGEGPLAQQSLLLFANQESSSVDVLAYSPQMRSFTAKSSTELPVPMCVLPMS